MTPLDDPERAQTLNHRWSTGHAGPVDLDLLLNASAIVFGAITVLSGGLLIRDHLRER